MQMLIESCGGSVMVPPSREKFQELSSMSLLLFHETFFRQISMVSYLPSDQRLKTYNNFKITFKELQFIQCTV